MQFLQDTSLLKEQAYIGGHWVSAAHGDVLTIRNPSTDEVLAHVSSMGEDDAIAAVEAAAQAYPTWKRKSAIERADLLLQWHQLIQHNAEDLAVLLTLEQGKPLAEARGEIANAAAFVRWFAEEARRLYGEIIPAPVAGEQVLVTRSPVGVTAAITPWNFPSAMITRKVAPALAAGCTVVLKPAGQTPLSALALAVLAERAGIPAGVFNVLAGNDQAIGHVLTTHPEVRKVSFTGSTRTGSLLIRQSADSVKNVSMELGGNAPFIVFDDVDIDVVVDQALQAKFRNAGQACVAANRIYVQNSIHDEFVRRLSVRMAELVPGNGLDPHVTLGPLINEVAVRKVEALLKEAQQHGATCLLGGKRHSLGRGFFEATLLTDVTDTMRIAAEEAFGPVAAILRFDTEQDVITRANATSAGLASYLYTNNLGRAARVSAALEYGMVGVNTCALANETAPFGGIKQSGIGREGARQGLDAYSETKYIRLSGLS